MRTLSAPVRLSLFVASLLLPVGAMAAPFLYKTYKLHNADAHIFAMLGYTDASVVYINELASVTIEQRNERASWERLGCDVFSVMKDAKAIEKGYNCRTFVCVGYQKGPKVCRGNDGKPYGGVVELQRRQQLMSIKDEDVRFDSYPVGERTTTMQKRIDDLAQYRCYPFYLVRLDTALGEGYLCDEVGRYPYYSHHYRCLDDWRDGEGLVCDNEPRDNEFELRLEAIARFGGGVNVSSASSSFSSESSSLVSSDSSVSSESSVQVSFADVIVGHYGYTAIMSLGAQGVVGGYPDGTFKPMQTINRAEFLKMLLSGLYPELIEEQEGCFPDVSRQWYASFVCSAKRLGWVAGYPDGNFRAAKTMTKAEGLKIIVSSLGTTLDSTAELPVGVAADAWFTAYIRKAVELGIVLEPTLDPNAQATRADAAVWMYRAQRIGQ